MKRSYVMLIVLASVVSCALSSAAAFTLDIFGNANMDDTIDESDIEYVKGIISGANEETELADANYDGKIDENDITQIEQTIKGVEKNLTVIQYYQPSTSPELTRLPVTVPLPIKTIAALSGTYGPEMLCVLGESDKIIAVTSSAATRGEIRKFVEDKPTVGSTFEWDMEKIVQLKPDVVLAYASSDYSEQRKTLEAAGITLLQMNFHKPEYYAGEARILGWLLGKKDRVEDLIDFEEEHLNFIEERVKGLKENEKPRVYAESYKELQYGSTGSVTAAIDPCGGIDIFNGEVTGTKDIDPEKVISSNPQVILKVTFNTYVPQSGYDATTDTEMAAMVESIMNRNGWNNIDAIKNKRVYVISSDASSIHACIFNLYVAKWLHPELFQDMDPTTIHNEWLNKFLGIDLKGIYGYPLIGAS